MSSSPYSSSSSPPPTSGDSPPSNLPLKKIPGDYGLPFLGPIRDHTLLLQPRQGQFFQSRIKKYNSTIFRTNMPPGPFIARNPKVIAVLDAVSFPVLFDTAKVEKKNVLDGTFFPSTAFTGGHRVCAYLDPSEPNHAVFKGWFLSLLAARHNKFIPLFQNSLSHLFANVEAELSKNGKQISTLERRTSLYDGFYISTSKILDEAEKLGIQRDEACHNLVFMAGFNAYGGMKTLFPALIKWVATAGESLHRRLANEIRTVVESEGGVTFSALDKMSLLKSVVYEAMRIEPPVPFQYGRLRLTWWSTTTTRRDGEKLLKYVYWSNGRETDEPTAENKQCPAKDVVVLLARVLLVEFFLRYDTLTAEVATLLLGSSVTITSLTKAESTA
ncbi:hypothetical protein C3L33_20872, partial [Rhododendron williamsianum]